MYGTIDKGIEIKDGVKLRCPKCNSVFAIKNDEEILYRNISIFYFKLKDQRLEIRCRQCKRSIFLDLIDGQIQQIDK